MRKFNRQTVAGLLRRLFFKNNSLSTLFAASLLFAIPLVVEAQVSPGTYTVCPGVGVCDYELPGAAVNDPDRVNGDIIEIITDTYVLAETLLVDHDITINGNDSILEADGLRGVEIPGLNTLIINNLTIRDALDPGEAPGGAISITGGGTLTLNDVTVEDSSASGGGGGLYNFNSTVEIIDSAFLRNDAGGAGGAINTRGASAVTNLTRVTVDGNTAFSRGGGLTAELGAQVNVIESTISRNGALSSSIVVDNFTASGSSNFCGAGPYGQTFIPGVNGITGFSYRISISNGAPSELVVPGRIRKDGPTGPLLVTTSTIIPAGTPGQSSYELTFTLDQPLAVDPLGTYAIELDVPGGAFSVYLTLAPGPYQDGELYPCNTTLGGGDYDFQILGGNGRDGGGIYSAGTVNLQNSTVSGNVGDGAFASAGNNVVGAEFSTVVNNSGNGLSAEAGNPGGVIAFGGSILAGNGGSDCFRDDLGALSISVDFNLIGDIAGCDFIVLQQNDLAGGAGSPIIDPLLGSLQDNGGPTFTYALDADSPAVDAGGACALTNDQRGTSRPQAGACDIGAYELAPTLGPLQTLIDAAAPGATINVPDGTYTEAITIGDGKTLSGSSPADVIIDASNLGSSAIIASGDFALIGISITGGSARYGGGIFADIDGTNISLDNVWFNNNIADTDGGAVYLRNGTLSATNTLFQFNSADDGNGGAIFSGTSATISDSSLVGNSASGNGGAIASYGTLTSSANVFGNNSANNGGAISIEGGALALGSSNNDVFNQNSATRNGGAIYESLSNLNVLDSDFFTNVAGDSAGGFAGNGGAIYSDRSAAIRGGFYAFNEAVEGDGVPGKGGAIFYNGNLSLVNAGIGASSAGVGGGLYGTTNGNATISGAIIGSNDAGDSGTAGGAIGGSGTLEITNSTLSGNTTSGNGNGAGIGLLAGSARLNNVTLAFNAATGLGGPLYAEPGALITFSNSLFASNSGGGTDCSTVISLGYNLFENTPCPILASDIVGDPLIELLASNGGPTTTHALQPQSPAVNAGAPELNFQTFDATTIGDWQLRGSAATDSGTLFLAGVGLPVGSAYLNDPVDVTVDFSARFQFRMTPSAGGSAADGITFSIVADPTVLGDTGNALGIAEFPASGGAEIGVVEGVSIEFDTWTDDGGIDGNQDHVGIDLDGNTAASPFEAFVGPNGTFSNGSDWTAWVDYDASTDLLEVRVSDTAIRPIAPTISTTVTIADFAGASAFIGFTGSTAFPPISGEHRILNFAFSNATLCEATDQRGESRPQGGACDIGAYEAAPVPLELGSVVLSTATPGEELDDGFSYPGVTDIPIIDIPIEKLTGDVNNPPASAPLGSFPLGSFPIGSFDLRSSPIGSFPLGSFPIGSFPIGSFPIGSFPIGSFPLSSIPLLREGGWSKVLEDITELDGAPLQTVTLEQVLTSSSFDESAADIELRDLAIEGSPLASLSLQGLSLGATTVEELDEWAANAGTSNEVCAELAANEPAFTDCDADDTLLSLEFKGAPVSALSLQSLPLGSFSTTAAPLGSFPIGSFPLGSFPLGSFPIGSFPIGSFPIGSFPLGSFPLGSFPIGSFPIGSFEVDGQPFCDFYDEQAGADGSAYPKTCSELVVDPSTAGLPELIAALAAEGASDISSTPLGSFPIGSFPIGSFPIGSFPLGSFPIGSFPIGSFPIGSFPIGSFPLGSFPIGSFPLGSFNVDGKPFCDVYDRQAGFDGADTCSELLADPATASLADLIAALVSNGASDISSTPLGSFPIGSFPIGSFPIGSFPLGSFDLNAPPLSDLSLGDFGGCELIESSSSDTCTSRDLNDSSTLLQVAAEYGSIEASPLGSFPLGSFGISELPMGSFPIGSFEINGTPLGSFPLGSFDLISSPLGSFPIGSFPLGSFPAEIVTDPTGLCDPCETLADAAKAGVINPSATLADLEVSTAFSSVTLAEVMDAMTMATLYGDGTLEDIDDLGSLTLGQLLIAMMLKTDFPWETIPLDQLDAQTFAATNYVDYTVDIPLTGTESEAFSVAVTLDEGFMYVKGSASLDIVTASTVIPNAALADPLIVDNGDGSQTLNFNLVLGGFSDNSLGFRTVPPLALGDYPATATVTLGSDEPLAADASNGKLKVIPDPFNDISDPNLAPTTPADILTLGFISEPDDNDFYRVAPPKAGDRVAVFMSNPVGDNDLIMYAAREHG